MKRRVAMVIAPHADDETLGCGGTIGVLKDQGFKVVVCLACGHSRDNRHIFGTDLLVTVLNEFRTAMKVLDVDEYECLGLPAGNLTACEVHEVNSRIADILRRTAPQIVFVPSKTDLHHDHNIVTYAAIVALRPYLKDAIGVEAVYEYEVLSETNVLPSYQESFKPDTYIDISSKLSDKLDACRCYKSQFQESLTPRSIEAVRQLALLRGSMIGTDAAEAFKTIYRKAI